LGVRYANKKIFFKIVFFFTVTILCNFDYCDPALGALLKQEVILNKTLLF
jgi:hypothetical protein